MCKKGFSLIEVLVVLSVFALIAVIANQVLFPIFRGGGKTGAAIIVKQNGNYAVSVIQRELYSARQVSSCTLNEVQYTSADGQSVLLSCTHSGGISLGSSRSLTSTEVEVESCRITCLPPSPPYKEVIIDFNLGKSGATRAEEKASFPFRARVTLRN